MPRFVTIGYGDQAGYDRVAPAVRSAAHASDVRLRQSGAVVGVAAGPVQVRNPNGVDLQVQAGAFLSASLPLAGFALIEAKDLGEAIDLVAGSPCAVAHGVVEIWPLDEL